ncbi:MAG: hypothetical protein BroJett026_06540 [Betaproteobacteria bacterium]|nr:MAG: hypothetical protein BroJett026_06540 [Betaproteobacteria bacterium]
MGSGLHALRIAAGIVLWAVHFALVYGSTAFACARGAAAAVPWIIGSATVVAALLAAAIAAVEWRRREAFESWLASGLAAVAFFAIVFEGVPVLFLAPCA